MNNPMQTKITRIKAYDGSEFWRKNDILLWLHEVKENWSNSKECSLSIQSIIYSLQNMEPKI